MYKPWKKYERVSIIAVISVAIGTAVVVVGCNGR
jgi:hypothetical protein